MVKPEDAVDAVYSEIVVYGDGGDIVLWCQRVRPVDAVHSGCSGIVVYGCGDIVFGAKRSNQWIQWMHSHSAHRTQWTQYTVDAVCSRCSTQWNSGIWWWGRCLWYKKVKPEDAVDAVYSEIVVYGDGGDIVLWCQRVRPVDAVHSGCSGIVVYGCGDIVFGAKKVKPVDSVDAFTQCTQDAVDTVHSGCSMQ